MRIPGLKTLKQSAIQIKKEFARSALILGYHRIASVPADPYNICISPQNFAEQLAVLKKTANIISLNELASHLKARSLPRRAVVLSFDDGYLDNLSLALPYLEHYHAPAIMFIVAGRLGQEMWWDRLARLVFNAKTLPAGLSEQGLGFHSIPKNSYREWQAQQKVSPHARLEMLLSIYHYLLAQPSDVREANLAQLANQVEHEMNGSQNNCLMTAEEVIQISRSGWVEIGAHSVTHPLLTSLSETEQRYEIEQSKACLEGLLDREVRAFSYPNGSTSPALQALVKKVGYSYACGSYSDLVWENSPIHHLPRMWVPNLGRAEFSTWLNQRLAQLTLLRI